MPVLPVGLAAVAAATEREGHEVLLLDLLSEARPEERVRKAVIEFQPDVIGISIRNIDDQNMGSPRFLLENCRGVISWCRDLSHSLIVLGGSGYSIFPVAALSYLKADMGIQGEGERPFTMLLSCIGAGSDPSLIPGLYIPGRANPAERSFVRCLDDFPLPGPHLWSLGTKEKWIPLQTRRGCPLQCSYCSTGSIEGRMLRKRSISAVTENISRHVEAGMTRFHFVDNLFNLPPSYPLGLCKEIADRDLEISWRSIVHPRKLGLDLVKAMKRAGCVEVSLGFESGSNRMLQAMRKGFRTEEIRSASELLRGEGIRRFGFLLLGGPGETRESVEESLSFAESLELDAMRITVGIRIYPFTALDEQARQEGVLEKQDNLLFPRFYLQRGLEEWLPETVRQWAAGRPSIIL